MKAVDQQACFLADTHWALLFSSFRQQSSLMLCRLRLLQAFFESSSTGDGFVTGFCLNKSICRATKNDQEQHKQNIPYHIGPIAAEKKEYQIILAWIYKISDKKVCFRLFSSTFIQQRRAHVFTARSRNDVCHIAVFFIEVQKRHCS